MNTTSSATVPAVFRSICAAPAVITPGKVQPSTGKGRSNAPVATSTRRAAHSPPPVRDDHETPSSATRQMVLLGK